MDRRGVGRSARIRLDLTLAIGAGTLTVGCGLLPGPTPEPMVELGPGITAPASDLSPIDRCMRDAGSVAVGVSPGRSGTNAHYGLSWNKETISTW